jgi:hypothetical protein
MSNDTALNSSIPLSDPSRDEEALKTLRLQDSDLDCFATYFERAFQGDSDSTVVLVGLLQRLCEVEKLCRREQSGIWIEDIVGRLTHRLYLTSGPGLDGASHFAREASDLTEHVFSEAFVTHPRIAGFVADGRSQ